ncbi:hypothetical protein TWF106_010703 [Orbilia oligospora]|uniref:Uncharacterized protein n=1 Tax=Orbilia oligospora TaxID=2813651 RepID=A0A7C8UMF0_ORBOL|nr:hypothetical protein TWF106_010703 [Orbilia oligospora]
MTPRLAPRLQQRKRQHNTRSQHLAYYFNNYPKALRSVRNFVSRITYAMGILLSKTQSKFPFEFAKDRCHLFGDSIEAAVPLAADIRSYLAKKHMYIRPRNDTALKFNALLLFFDISYAHLNNKDSDHFTTTVHGKANASFLDQKIIESLTGATSYDKASQVIMSAYLEAKIDPTLIELNRIIDHLLRN